MAVRYGQRAPVLRLIPGVDFLVHYPSLRDTQRR
jgi:hypothetical protein